MYQHHRRYSCNDSNRSGSYQGISTRWGITYATKRSRVTLGKFTALGVCGFELGKNKFSAIDDLNCHKYNVSIKATPNCVEFNSDKKNGVLFIDSLKILDKVAIS